MIIVKYLFLKKNLYYISRADVNDDDFANDDDFFDYNVVDYDDDYHDDFIVNYDELVYYKKLSNCFESLVSIKNNIVNWINSHNITLLVDDINIFIC